MSESGQHWIDRKLCLDYIDYLYREYRPKGKRVTNFTLHTYYRILNGALNAVVRIEIIKLNPFTKINNSDKIRLPESKRSYMPIKEVRALIDTPMKIMTNWQSCLINGYLVIYYKKSALVLREDCACTISLRKRMYQKKIHVALLRNRALFSGSKNGWQAVRPLRGGLGKQPQVHRLRQGGSMHCLKKAYPAILQVRSRQSHILLSKDGKRYMTASSLSTALSAARINITSVSDGIRKAIKKLKE